MTTDPVKDAGDHTDAACDYSARMAEAERLLSQEFIRAALTKTADDEVDFHTTTDWTDGLRRRRPAKVWEVMLETLEGNDEIAAYMMQSIMLCAKKGDPEAQSAIRKMAVEFAKHNAYVE